MHRFQPPYCVESEELCGGENHFQIRLNDLKNPSFNQGLVNYSKIKTSLLKPM